MIEGRHYFIKGALISAGAYAALFFANALISSHLPHDVYGDYRYAITLVLLFANMIPLGRDQLISSYFRAMQNQPDTEKFIFGNWLLKSIQFNVLCFSTLLTLYFLGGMWYYQQSLANFFYAHASHIILLCTPILAFRSSYLSVMVCLNNQNIANLISQIIPNVMMIALLLFAVTSNHTSYINVTLIAISFTLSKILSVAALRQMTIQHLRGKSATLSPKKEQQWISDSRSIFINSLAATISTSMTIVLLEVLGKEASVGQFAIIIIIANMPYTSIAPIKTDLRTHIRAQINNPKKLQSIQIHQNRLQLCILTLITLLIIYYIKPILLLFGKHNLILEKEATIAILLNSVWCYICSSKYYLLYTQYKRENSIIQITRTVFQLIALLVIIPYHDLMGAIIAPILITYVSNIYTSFRVYRLFGINSLALW